MWATKNSCIPFCLIPVFCLFLVSRSDHVRLVCYLCQRRITDVSNTSEHLSESNDWWCECVFCQRGDERCLCRCSFLSIIASPFAGLKNKKNHNCRVPCSVGTFLLEPWNWNSSALHWRVFYWMVHNFIISWFMNPGFMYICVDLSLCLWTWFHLCLHYSVCR